MASTTIAHKLRLVSVGALLVLLAACGGKQVVVDGSFPPPLIEPLPVTLGVVYPPAFANHEFFDEAKGRTESDWLVKTGTAQVEFWSTLLGGMFAEVVVITDSDTLAAWENRLDGVIVPNLDDLQYTIPLHTNVKIYEIWMRYRFRLVDPVAINSADDGGLTYNPVEHIAEWTLTAYGKTPSAFLQSDTAAVNTAAIVALRDAGANFATSLHRVPDVVAWLDRTGGGE